MIATVVVPRCWRNVPCLSGIDNGEQISGTQRRYTRTSSTARIILSANFATGNATLQLIDDAKFGKNFFCALTYVVGRTCII